MLRFLIRRTLFFGLVVLGAVAVIFALAHVIPADPARAALGPDASYEQVEHYRREMGLDRPLWIQFWRYLSRLARGDMGVSIVTRNRVSDDLGEAIPATVELLLPSLLFSVLCGIGFGATSAVRRGQAADHLSRILSILGMSLPVFWFGLVLQLVFYKHLSWFPAGGRLPITAVPPDRITGLYAVDALLAGNWESFLQALHYLVLPVITLSTVNVAIVARITRASLLEVLGRDYVRTARAKGLGGWAVIYKHALRNALIPVVTVFGMRVGIMFGGAVLTESIFAWPGVGRYAFYGLRHLDLPVVTAFTIYMTLTYAVLNMLVDASYSLLDPRIRSE
ncbi:MAG: ABC transporter permease [Armatimonadetes bacterium]|nr:ABC transporter permease [Armatimonadota bacterium]